MKEKYKFICHWGFYQCSCNDKCPIIVNKSNWLSYNQSLRKFKSCEFMGNLITNKEINTLKYKIK